MSSIIGRKVSKVLPDLSIIMSRILLFLFFLSFFMVSFASAASGPAQPLEGPGGADYLHAEITDNEYGSGATGYFLFEPDSPKPAMAPLIIFLHGWFGTRPSAYGAWIEHLVRKGNIVVYPIYQSSFTSLRLYTRNSLQAVRDAIEVLESGNHVRPDLERLAVAGHSCGGILSANVAAIAPEFGLPAPKAVMSVEPGLTSLFPMEDLSMIPADTLLLTVVGDRDHNVGDRDAKKIFHGASQVPLENKDFITMISDRNGRTSLLAGHFAPCCSPVGGEGDHSPIFGTDGLDYYGLWKLFDALTDAAFYGENREYALGNTWPQRYMGEWSDGTPVKELAVTDNP